MSYELLLYILSRTLKTVKKSLHFFRSLTFKSFSICRIATSFIDCPSQCWSDHIVVIMSCHTYGSHAAIILSAFLMSEMSALSSNVTIIFACLEFIVADAIRFFVSSVAKLQSNSLSLFGTWRMPFNNRADGGQPLVDVRRRFVWGFVYMLSSSSTLMSFLSIILCLPMASMKGT